MTRKDVERGPTQTMRPTLPQAGQATGSPSAAAGLSSTIMRGLPPGLIFPPLVVVSPSRQV
jgi:hypothetical protein